MAVAGLLPWPHFPEEDAEATASCQRRGAMLERWPPGGAQAAFGPGGCSHVTPETAVVSLGTCPGEPSSAIRRLAPPAVQQLVGEGPQLGLILRLGPGAKPAWDRSVGKDQTASGATPASHPTPHPRLSFPRRARASSFHGNRSWGCGPRSSSPLWLGSALDPTGAERNTKWGTSHHSGLLGLASGSPQQTQEASPGTRIATAQIARVTMIGLLAPSVWPRSLLRGSHWLNLEGIFPELVLSRAVPDWSN